MGKEHWVVCKVCGEKFDVSRTKTHFDGTRYTCSSCYRKKKKGGKSSWFKKNWKFIFGPFFIYSGLTSIGEYEWSTVFITFGIGILLLFFHFYPKVKKLSEIKAEKKIELKEKQGEISVCPDCGAKYNGAVCKYCDYTKTKEALQIEQL